MSVEELFETTNAIDAELIRLGLRIRTSRVQWRRCEAPTPIAFFRFWTELDRELFQCFLPTEEFLSCVVAVFEDEEGQPELAFWVAVLPENLASVLMRLRETLPVGAN